MHIVPINKQINFKNKNPIEIQRDINLQKKIDEYWNEYFCKNEGYFNGDIYSVINIEETKDTYNIEIGKTKYADFTYSLKNNDITVNPLSSAILFKTKDDYYLAIKNNHNKINIIGGFASNQDFINEVLNPKECLKRELREELNLNLDNKKDVLEYSKMYLKLPDEDDKVAGTGIIFTGLLNYTKEQLEQYFNDQKDNFEEDEIKELLFYTKDNYKKLDDIENKISYLVKLIEMIEKTT